MHHWAEARRRREDNRRPEGSRKVDSRPLLAVLPVASLRKDSRVSSSR